jgi:hypothetical protein
MQTDSVKQVVLVHKGGHEWGWLHILAFLQEFFILTDGWISAKRTWYSTGSTSTTSIVDGIEWPFWSLTLCKVIDFAQNAGISSIMAGSDGLWSTTISKHFETAHAISPMVPMLFLISRPGTFRDSYASEQNKASKRVTDYHD